MILLKGCPRCRGDLRTGGDFYGEYKQCVQCGYLEDVDSPTLRTAVAKTERKAA